MLTTDKVLVLLAVVKVLGALVNWLLRRPQSPVHALVVWRLVCTVTHRQKLHNYLCYFYVLFLHNCIFLKLCLCLSFLF